MTWIALTGADMGPDGDFPLHRGDAPLARMRATHALETTAPQTPLGSLMLEADLGRAPRSEHTLLMAHQAGPQPSHVSFHIGADGTVTYARRHGAKTQQVTLESGRDTLEGLVRITVSWDLSQAMGMLSVEKLSEGLLIQKSFDAPLPLSRQDIEVMCDPNANVLCSPVLLSAACSDAAEPVGLHPCFASETPILTPDGYVPIQQLKPGDRVTNLDGQPRNVLWVGGRVVPARGRFRPIRLNAPYFGLRADVVVAPEARLMVDGPEVEYLFNSEAVLVEAHDLLHTGFAALETTGETIRYYHVLLDDHDMLVVAGAPMESLFIGDLAGNPDMLATTILKNYPVETVPQHRRLAHRALHDYEAVTLRAALLSR